MTSDRKDGPDSTPRADEQNVPGSQHGDTAQDHSRDDVAPGADPQVPDDDTDDAQDD